MIDIKKIVDLHAKYLLGDKDGVKANLRGANLREATLHGADLYGADLYGADLRDAGLRDADLRNADLRNADLRGATLHGADLLGADLYGANLREANLREANLREANLREADLREANLREADLQDCIGNSIEIKSIQTNKYTISYTDSVIQIGCKNYTYEEWFSFSDETISVMDVGALEWWADWKPLLLAITKVE